MMMAAPITEAMPKILMNVKFSLKKITPKMVATTGSIVAKIEALEGSTFERPFVYKAKGKVVMTTASKIMLSAIAPIVIIDGISATSAKGIAPKKPKTKV